MLTVDDVVKVYKIGAFGRAHLTAVRNVSFSLQAGEVVSLIGESGSGKTTIGKMVLRLVSTTSGSISVDGKNISSYRGAGLKEYYRQVQGVFQDPFSSYNPIFKADRVFAMVKDQYFPGVKQSEWDAKIESALSDVRLDPAAVLHKYPHQLSGGQLQRMLIARALLLDIKLLVADEIISMLDASTRIDVLNLLADLQARGLGVLFVTHDLALGNYISTRTVILHKGVAVEMGDTEKVFADPQHPYTRKLLASVPQLEHKWREEPLDLDDLARERCVYHELIEPDADALPAHVEVAPGHLVACARADSTLACERAPSTTSW